MFHHLALLTIVPPRIGGKPPHTCACGLSCCMSINGRNYVAKDYHGKFSFNDQKLLTF